VIDTRELVAIAESLKECRRQDYEDLIILVWHLNAGRMEEAVKAARLDTKIREMIPEDILEALQKFKNQESLKKSENPYAVVEEEHSSFIKHDQKKSRPDLLPADVLIKVSEVLAHGAEKYSPDNWRKCENPQRYIAATLRHVLAYQTGEKIDPDSGMHHLAHAVCSLMFAYGIEMDNEG